MKFELRMWREDAKRWAFADCEIDEKLANSAPDKEKFLAAELVPYLCALLELEISE